MLKKASLLLAVTTLTAIVFAAQLVRAEETGSDIPKNAYHDQSLTNSERAAIAEEENVSPNDGRASVPAGGDQAIIPDAADAQKGDAFVNAPADGALPGDVHEKGTKSKEGEANVILDQSKENFRVSRNEYDRCLKQWDPQTQMSKDDWAASCRTTLEYFPETK
jgi:hypothetical protein